MCLQQTTRNACDGGVMKVMCEVRRRRTPFIGLSLAVLFDTYSNRRRVLAEWSNPLGVKVLGLAGDSRQRLLRLEPPRNRCMFLSSRMNFLTLKPE